MIEITDTFVSWQAPHGIGERSFRFDISEIDRIICVPSVEAELGSTYSLLTKTHEKILLKPAQSGVSIHKFVQSLVDAGVVYETREQA